MADRYFTRPNGVATVDDGDVNFLPPVGWVEVDFATYSTELANVEAAIAARRASRAHDECVAKKAVFDDLVAAGIPGSTAHALSGWDGGPC